MLKITSVLILLCIYTVSSWMNRYNSPWMGMPRRRMSGIDTRSQSDIHDTGVSTSQYGSRNKAHYHRDSLGGYQGFDNSYGRGGLDTSATNEREDQYVAAQVGRSRSDQTRRNSAYDHNQETPDSPLGGQQVFGSKFDDSGYRADHQQYVADQVGRTAADQTRRNSAHYGNGESSTSPWAPQGASFDDSSYQKRHKQYVADQFNSQQAAATSDQYRKRMSSSSIPGLSLHQGQGGLDASGTYERENQATSFQTGISQQQYNRRNSRGDHNRGSIPGCNPITGVGC